MVRGSVLVCGSRGLQVPALVVASSLVAMAPDGWLVLSGGARGVDSVAREAAWLLGWEFVEFLPQYGLLGRRAPLVRNAEMVQLASAVVAYWDGRSRGTAHTVGLARQAGVPVLVRRWPPD